MKHLTFKARLVRGLPHKVVLRRRCGAGQPRCYSYYMNVCTLTYTSWNWDWERWEQEIDWMALHGINLVLAYTGREYVYRKIWRALGLNHSEYEASGGGMEAGPAFLAFSRTEAWSSYDWAGPDGGRTEAGRRLGGGRTEAPTHPPGTPHGGFGGYPLSGEQGCVFS